MAGRPATQFESEYVEVDDGNLTSEKENFLSEMEREKAALQRAVFIHLDIEDGAVGEPGDSPGEPKGGGRVPLEESVELLLK